MRILYFVDHTSCNDSW